MFYAKRFKKIEGEQEEQRREISLLVNRIWELENPPKFKIGQKVTTIDQGLLRPIPNEGIVVSFEFGKNRSFHDYIMGKVKKQYLVLWRDQVLKFNEHELCAA